MMKSKSVKLIFGIGILAAILVYAIYQIAFSEKEKSFHVAFVGPISGSSAKAGKAHIQGVQLYVDQVNAAGGVNGRKIVLDIYDDQNDKVRAAQKATEIAEQNRALAVIGHNYSSCSISAGKVYKAHGIPAVSPSSTDIKVTMNNDWYFRTVFNNNLLGRFLANYAKSVLKQKRVSIIQEDLAYGAYLAKVFEQTSQELGLEIVYKGAFKVRDKHLDQKLEDIVADLKAGGDPGIIFMATHAPEGIRLVKMMRDTGVMIPLIAPTSFATQVFQRGFDNFPKEKMNPGHYTRGIYVGTPFIIDTANEKAQHFREAYVAKYEENPGWHAAYSYDAAMVVLEAIARAGIQGDPDTIKADREKIRDYLASLTHPSEALEGITGFNYFDAIGNCPKPVSIGVYKSRNIISALTQLQVVRNLGEIHDLEKSMNEERVLLIDGKYMYKTNVVYTGIKMNEISSVDPKTLTCMLDFNVWFRYQGDIDVQNVRFLNSAERIELAVPIDTNAEDHLNYRLYNVRGLFKTDFLPRRYGFRQHILGLRFRHNLLPRDNLIYVTDVLGMRLKGEISFLNRLNDAQIFRDANDWKVNQAQFFQNIGEREPQGRAEYLNLEKGIIEHSAFNFAIRIQKKSFTPRGMIPLEYSRILLVLSFIMLLIFGMISAKTAHDYTSKSIWFFQAISLFLLLLTTEICLVNWLIKTIDIYHLKLLKLAFDVLWWIAPAYLLTLAVNRFVWIPLEKRTGRTIPTVIRRFTILLLYALASFGIIAYVLDQQLTSILATSGMLAMIIGLAIQINISNIFSGIAINVERPFRLGDWVRIGNFSEGKVVDITWRTIRLQTRDDCILSIPNSQASESPIHNFSYPDDRYKLIFTVQVDPVHPPARVRKILTDALLSAERVLSKPPPAVRYLGLNKDVHSQSTAWAADYLILCEVNNYGKKMVNLEAVAERVWNHLNRAGIPPIIQRQDVFMFRGDKSENDPSDALSPVLNHADISRPLSDAEAASLREQMNICRFAPGETILRQGTSGDSLFVITEGVVSVTVELENGKTAEMARLGAGHFFGEISLLTGELRSATIQAVTETYISEITKENIEPFMATQPEFAGLLTDALARRKKATEVATRKEQKKEAAQEEVRMSLSGRIRRFFNFSKDS